MKTRETRNLSIAFGLIVMSTVLVMLALSTLSGLAQVEDGYPAPIDYGYPIDFGYPVDYGYPIYDPYPVIGYPVIDPYPIEYGYPVDIGYPVFEPVPAPDYPEPKAVQVEPDIYSNPVQYEQPSPYRDGRNLWQEIVYQFAKLLELMK